MSLIFHQERKIGLALGSSRDQRGRQGCNVLMDTLAPVPEKGSLLTCAGPCVARLFVPVTLSPTGKVRRTGKGGGERRR